MQADIFSPSSSPTQSAGYGENGSATIYGRTFLATLVDEAHDYRNIKKGYWAVKALRERSDVILTMTATPAVGRPAVSSLAIHVFFKNFLREKLTSFPLVFLRTSGT